MQKPIRLAAIVAPLFFINLSVAAKLGQPPISQQESDAIDAYVKRNTKDLVVTHTYMTADNEKNQLC